MDMNKKWHQTVMNLLLGRKVCGVCLNIDDNLVQWEDLFVFEHDDLNVESSLRQIMISTFSPSIMEIISTPKFCQKCIDEIIKAFIFIHRIQKNYKHIERRLTEISEQMKWTEYLDETGSLCEPKTNLVNLDEINNTEAKKEDERQRDNSNSNMSGSVKKTHKIFLNNESLKTKLVKDPEMHKFLFTKEVQKETKLPAGITVRKVKECMDMAVVAPQELLELNWAQDTDYETIIPNIQLSKNKLHSNEALIMDLMEKAKTNKIHTNTPPNLNKIEIGEINIEDSLTVKLLQRPNTNNGIDHFDDNDIIPQDLLELKWPDDEMCNAKNCMKIPVKELKFNEALTVKYIPKQNSNKNQEIDNDIAPHELLELSWNDNPDKVDSENTYLLDTEQKHSIDLTKWLQDQGLSTIKTNSLENKKQNMNIQTACEDEIIKINPQKVTVTVTDNNHFKKEESNSVNVMLDCNDDVEMTTKYEPHKDIEYLRCALCCLTFEQFELYSNHYKTHGITEVAKCYKCPTEFPIIECLSKHLSVMHSENIAYCTICFALLHQEKFVLHMSTNHAGRVNIINFPKDDSLTVKSDLETDGYCKICKQPLNMPSSGPHTCIDKDSRCSECKQACIHEKYLSSYRDQLRAKKHTFKCTDCKFKYKTKYDIIKHSNKVHLKHKPYRCKVCNIRFLLKASLGKHNNLSHARCHTCRRVFEDQSSLSKHRCKAVAAGVTKCELCGQRFSETKCKQHKESALAVTDVCVICQRVVPVKCNMVRHMEYIHNLSLKKDADATVYECVICELEFKDHKDFSEHSWVHTGVHECHVCAKRFTSKTLYESHYQMHLAKPCDLAKSHVCSVCGDQVKGKHALDQHMQAHSDHEKCPICSKYIEKTSLSNHIDGHGVSESKFKCPHCPLTCNTHSQLEGHVNKFHLHQRPYQCDTCKKSFYCKRLLRQHMNIHNKLKCEFCERMYARKRDLDIHLRTH